MAGASTAWKGGAHRLLLLPLLAQVLLLTAWHGSAQAGRPTDVPAGFQAYSFPQRVLYAGQGGFPPSSHVQGAVAAEDLVVGEQEVGNSAASPGWMQAGKDPAAAEGPGRGPVEDPTLEVGVEGEGAEDACSSPKSGAGGEEAAMLGFLYRALHGSRGGEDSPEGDESGDGEGESAPLRGGAANSARGDGADSAGGEPREPLPQTPEGKEAGNGAVEAGGGGGEAETSLGDRVIAAAASGDMDSGKLPTAAVDNGASGAAAAASAAATATEQGSKSVAAVTQDEGGSGAGAAAMVDGAPGEREKEEEWVAEEDDWVARKEGEAAASAESQGRGQRTDRALAQDTSGWGFRKEEGGEAQDAGRALLGGEDGKKGEEGADEEEGEQAAEEDADGAWGAGAVLGAKRGNGFFWRQLQRLRQEQNQGLLGMWPRGQRRGGQGRWNGQGKWTGKQQNSKQLSQQHSQEHSLHHSQQVLREQEMDTEEQEQQLYKLANYTSMGVGESITTGAGTNKVALSFNGINAWSNSMAGTGKYKGTNVMVDPPDVSGCVGAGFVVQPVNIAMAVFTTRGRRLAGSVPINQFLRLNPRVNTVSSSNGDDVGDGSCIYDKNTGRFFYASYWTAGDSPSRFAKFRVSAGVIMAMSSYRNPLGPWSIYLIPTDNTGIISNDDSKAPLKYPGTPFFGDYPQLGIDSQGVYVTTNQFGFGATPTAYVGQNIYAVGKWPLAKRRSFLGLRWAIPTQSTSGGVVTPVKEPADLRIHSDPRHGGTMYFVSIVPPLSGGGTRDAKRGAERGGGAGGGREGSREWVGEGGGGSEKGIGGGGEEGGEGVGRAGMSKASDNYVGIWAMTNTKALNLGRPLAPALHLRLLPLPPFLYAPNTVTQKQGPRPLARRLGLNFLLQPDTNANPAAGNILSCTATLTGIRIYVAWSVGHRGAKGPLTSAAAVASFFPSWSTIRKGQPVLRASRDAMRVFFLSGQSLVFPAVNFNSRGKGLLAFGVMGSSYFPSAGFIVLNGALRAQGPITIAARGRFPLESSAGYENANPGSKETRYGDWHTVTVDELGHAWAMTEWVSGVRNLPTSTRWTNWGTRIFRVLL